MICGIMNVYKEAGYTSHDVVAKLRGIVGQRKIGHTGTLDPAAEGVLPVCLGAATKVCDMLTDLDKSYRAVMMLGVRTDTQDMTGTVLSRSEVEADEAAVRQVLAGFLGQQEQVPPMYSARKVNGKRLYELAREGKEVERKARPVCFYRIEPVRIELPEAEFDVTCSKGTYIRTLCADAGERLGCGGCMKSLVRTRVGRFGIERALRLGELQGLADEGRLMEAVMPVDRLFGQYPGAVVSGVGEKLLRNGNPMPVGEVAGWLNAEKFVEAGGREPDNLAEGVRVYDRMGRFQAVYRMGGDGLLRVWKMFLSEG